jgi:hypothetical protein
MAQETIGAYLGIAAAILLVGIITMVIDEFHIHPVSAQTSSNSANMTGPMME